MIRENGMVTKDEKSAEVAPRATRRTFSREYKLLIVTYDPTNGLMSRGDIIRSELKYTPPPTSLEGEPPPPMP